MSSENLIRSYYEAFNNKDWEGMLSLLTDDVVHDPNESERECGKKAFSNFLAVMDEHYSETVEDLHVLTSGDGKRASSEFTIKGSYLKTQIGLPPATGQKYEVQVGAFFEIAEGKIARVTNYYNLAAWIKAVS